MEYRTKGNRIILTKKMFSKNFLWHHSNEHNICFSLTKKGTIMVGFLYPVFASHYNNFAEIEVHYDGISEVIYVVKMFSCNDNYYVVDDTREFDNIEQIIEVLEDSIILITQNMKSHINDHIKRLRTFKKELEKI